VKKLLKKNLLIVLQQKKFNNIKFNDKTNIHLNFNRSSNNWLKINYVDYPFLTLKIFKKIFKSGIFFGFNLFSFFKTEISKWILKEQFNTKITTIQHTIDQWYFFGFCLKCKSNFLQTTLIIWNNFEDETFEKFIFLFNPRITLFDQLPNKNLNILNYFKTLKKKKKFYFIWKRSRMYSHFTFKRNNFI